MNSRLTPAGPLRKTVMAFDPYSDELWKRIAYKYMLTDSQSAVLKLACKGRCVKEIAIALNRSPKTVEAHRMELYEKFRVVGMNHVIVKAFLTIIDLYEEFRT